MEAVNTIFKIFKYDLTTYSNQDLQHELTNY